jgi:hypothetical protein
MSVVTRLRLQRVAVSAIAVAAALASMAAAPAPAKAAAPLFRGGPSHVDSPRRSAPAGAPASAAPASTAAPHMRAPGSAGPNPGTTRKRVARSLGAAQPQIPNALSDLAINFQGTADTGNFPPDPIIAAGPSNVVLAVNTNVDIYAKTGSKLKSQSIKDVFAGLSPGANQPRLFDPWVVYDPYASRFWLIAVAGNNSPHNSTLLIAVSKGSDATQGWDAFSIDPALNGSDHIDNWCDFPKLGYDTRAIYLTCNMFDFPIEDAANGIEGGDFNYAKVFVLTKDQLINGTCCQWWSFWDVRERGGEAAWAIEPARMHGATDADGEYLADAHGGGTIGDAIEVWHIANPQNCCTGGATGPDFTSNVQGVDHFVPAPDARQPGTSVTLDTGSRRGDTRLQTLIWQGGHLSTAQNLGCPDGRTVCASYTEVDTSGYPSMRVVNDWVTDNSRDRFYPSLDINGAGNKTMVYSVSGPNLFAGTSFLFIPSAAICTSCFNTETSIASGQAAYDRITTTSQQRWGDYSGAAPDPDGDGIWVFGEFAASAGRWGTQVALTRDRVPTALTYTGPRGAASNATVTLSATLVGAGSRGPVPHFDGSLTFTLGSQSCGGTTDDTGSASCSLTLAQPDGTYPLTVSFPGEPVFMPASITTDFEIGSANRATPNLVYTGGDVSADFQDSADLRAVLTVPSSTTPIVGAPITFSLAGETCSEITNSSGVAECHVTLRQRPGAYTVVTSFAGDDIWAPVTISTPFTITKEESSVTLTSSADSPDFGKAVTYRAAVSTDDGPVQPAGSVTFQRGSIALAHDITLDSGDHASLTVPLLQVGVNQIRATYNGDDYFKPSTAVLFPTVTCKTTFTGAINNGLNLNAGSTCLNNASIYGLVVINPGAAVSITNSRFNGGISSNGALALTICGSNVQGSVQVQSTKKYVLVGDGGDDDAPACAGSTFSTSALIYSSQGGLELAGNTIGGSLIVSGTSGVGPDLESQAPEIEANTIQGSLSCTGNSPAPTNDGHPNHLSSPASGQCAGL